jgi:hypothetical protein
MNFKGHAEQQMMHRHDECRTTATPSAMPPPITAATRVRPKSL